MTAYGATPEARQLRIRAGVLLPFWEQRLRDENGTDVEAEERLAVILVQGGAARSALYEPDNDQLEPRVQIAGHWARLAEAPPEAPEPDEGEELAELIGRALPDHAPVDSPGSLENYFRGAFEVWLFSHQGEESFDLDLVGKTATIFVVGRLRAVYREIQIDEIPTKAWAAGESAVRALLEEVRAPLPSGPSQGGG